MFQPLRLQHLLLSATLLACPPGSVKASSDDGSGADRARSYSTQASQDRSAWERHGKTISRLLDRLREKGGALNSAGKDLETKREELAKLQREKEQAMRDIREGQFCTGCSRTRAELLAAGEPFPHPNQQVRAATPEEIAKTEQSYNSRIERATAALRTAEEKYKKLQADASAAYHELNATIPRYHSAMMAEGQNQSRAWSAEKQMVEADLQRIHEERKAAADAVKSAQSESTRNAALAAQQNVQGRFDGAVRSARTAESQARARLKSFSTALRNDMDALARKAQTIPEIFGVPSGSHLAARLRTPPLAPEYTVLAVMIPTGSALRPGDLRQLLGSPNAGTASPPPKASSTRRLLEGP